MAKIPQRKIDRYQKLKQATLKATYCCHRCGTPISRDAYYCDSCLITLH